LESLPFASARGVSIVTRKKRWDRGEEGSYSNEQVLPKVSSRDVKSFMIVEGPESRMNRKKA